ncbi:MAG TPA: hypothetical protein VMR50_02020 [Myxococcota bacterium]|nr:hypothetical protein [Myxococcota bacterium]
MRVATAIGVALWVAASSASAGTTRFHAISLSAKLENQVSQGVDFKIDRSSESAKDVVQACTGTPTKTQGLYLQESCGFPGLENNHVVIFDTETMSVTPIGSLELDVDFALTHTKGGPTQLLSASMPFHAELKCDSAIDLVLDGVIDMAFEPNATVCLSTFKAHFTGTNVQGTAFVVAPGSALSGKKPLVFF